MHVQQGDFESLFIEDIGWDHFNHGVSVSVNSQTYLLEPVAEKRGVQVFLFVAPERSRIPEYAIRRKIESEVTKLAFEHLIIFTDAKRTQQVWQWVLREKGKA